MLKSNDDGIMSIRHDRSEAAGLKYRPLAVTVRDTLAWWDTVPKARRESPRFTISSAKEAAALVGWRARRRQVGWDDFGLWPLQASRSPGRLGPSLALPGSRNAKE
jgi:hypothetical protein